MSANLVSKRSSKSFKQFFGTAYTTIKRFFLLIWLSLPFWGITLNAQQSKADSLLSVLKTSKEDTNKVNILYNICNAVYTTEPFKAMDLANQGLTLSYKILYTKGTSICLNALGLSYYQIGKFDTALIYFEKRLKVVSQLNDRKGIASTCDNLGVLYIHFGKIDSALQFRIKANEIYADLNEKCLLANGYTWIGNIYKEKGEYSKGLDYYLKALKIYEAEKDEQNIGYPVLNISSIYRYMKQYKEAKRYALDAKIKFITANNSNGAGVSLYRLALIYNDEKEYDSSIKYLLEAKVILEKTQNNYFLTLVEMLLGTSYRNKGNTNIALAYFNSAIEPAKKIGDVALISGLFQNIGSIHYDKGNYLKASEYMLISDKGFTEINDKKTLMENSSSFIEIYSQLNKPDKVLKYFHRYQQLSDTLFNEQNSKSIAEMQTRFETEKKDQQIKLQELTLKNKNLILRISLISGGLLFISFVLIIILFRKKNKAYKQLVYQNLGISEIKQQLIYNNDLIEDNENGIPKTEKFNNSSLDEEQKIRIIECLNKLIENKIYTKQSLTLNGLAEKCGTNRTYLSQVINDTFQTNFNTFINKLRIDEARQILSGINCDIPLKELYQKLGFHSYSVFNEAFNKFIGVTPAFYQKTAKNARNILNIESIDI